MFLNVQIHYRGLIPKIHKRGPIVSIELPDDTIKELMAMGIPVTDPTNGYPIQLDDVVEMSEQKSGEEEPKEEAATLPGEAELDEAAAILPDEPKPEEKAAELEQPVSTEEPKSEETKVEPVATVNVGFPEFDFNKVKGYSNLSKGKKREIRAAYTELAATLDQESVYAELNKMATDTAEAAFK